MCCFLSALSLFLSLPVVSSTSGGGGTTQLTGTTNLSDSGKGFVPQFAQLLNSGKSGTTQLSKSPQVTRSTSGEGKYAALSRDELNALLSQLDDNVATHVRSLQARAREDRQLLQSVI